MAEGGGRLIAEVEVEVERSTEAMEEAEVRVIGEEEEVQNLWKAAEAQVEKKREVTVGHTSSQEFLEVTEEVGYWTGPQNVPVKIPE
jgi:outer membrane protein TolC